MLPGRSFLAASVAGCGMWVGSAYGADSAYTKLDLDACTVLEEFEEGGGVSLRCNGYNGIPVFVAEGDLRMSVAFGAANETWQSFAPFNSVGTTVEWRLDQSGQPFAAILRFLLDSGEPDIGKAQVLSVSSIGSNGNPGCVTALVEASVEQANGVARGAAAFAARHDCDTEPAVYIGPVQSMANSWSNSIIEGEN